MATAAMRLLLIIVMVGRTALYITQAAHFTDVVKSLLSGVGVRVLSRSTRC